MKPTKNHIFCVDCWRPKMLFASEKKALRCIEMNGDEIFNASGRRPIRAYFCIACGGWHITSRKYNPNCHSIVERYFMKQDELTHNLKKLAELLPNTNLKKAIKAKVGSLHQMVMKKIIIKSQCEQMIQTLMDIFEAIIKAKMLTPNTRKYFDRFRNLCTIYLDKVAKGKFIPDIKSQTLSVI